MTAHFLAGLFEPRGIAVIGASEKAGSLGQVILKNLLDNGYAGRLVAVNPRYPSVLGVPCVPDLEADGGPVDLAIITTAPRTIPEIMAQCGRLGIRNAIVVSHPAAVSANSATMERRIRDAALHAGVRFLGPKSLGIVCPHAALNATFTEISAVPGDLALVTQSGAMCASVLDWATTNRIGISLAVSLGEAMNVDFGDVLDYLANDERTRYILLHVEKIRHARRFISALRSAARIKPVILLKSGQHAGDDDMNDDDAELADRVFDAAVRRAGVVRVNDLGQLFHAARALASGFHPRGSRLAILSNGTGPARMAADSARRLGVPLASLQPDTVAALKPLLPREWRARNPIDLGGDATSERYLDATRLIALDEQIDAVLVVLSPLALVSPQAVAEGLAEIARNQRITLCCCFMGGAQIQGARQVLEEAGIPVFRTPDTVIELFHNISAYYRNQQLLLQVPSPGRPSGSNRSGSGRILLEALIGERRRVLSHMETHTLLHAHGVPVRPSMVAHTATEAMFVAEQIGLPVDIHPESSGLADHTDNPDDRAARHKLTSIESVRNALHDLQAARPEGATEKRIGSIAISPHRERPHARHFVLRVFRDPVFGPVILLGGNHGETLRDHAVALPPLNRFLARNLIEATHVGQTLGAGTNRPAADGAALEDALLAISNLICESPVLETLEIKPLIVDEQGCLAINARITLDPARGAGQGRYSHMAIHPYPAHLRQEWSMPAGKVRVRPVRPEDAPLEQAFVNAMSDESRYFRFMDSTRELPPSQIARLTQVDYDREMALIAVTDEAEGERQVGSARYVQTPDGESVEFGLAVDDAWQKCGLGRRLMEAIIDCAREKLYRTMVGDVLADNQKMLNLMTRLGFAILPHPDGHEMKRVVKPLRD